LSRDRFGIARYYRSRARYVHYDDSTLEDQWQLEVYLAARDRMIAEGFDTVIDVGCGSGYKLITQLGQFETTGVELPRTVEFLVRKYPDRRWLEAAPDDPVPNNLHGDVVICADVIEHVVDPDQLMDSLNGIDFKYLFLSTPDRGLVYQRLGSSRLGFLRRGFWGPPANPSHQREWKFAEFRVYVERHFEVIDHLITNRKQSTQMVICRRKLR